MGSPCIINSIYATTTAAAAAARLPLANCSPASSSRLISSSAAPPHFGFSIRPRLRNLRSKSFITAQAAAGAAGHQSWPPRQAAQDLHRINHAPATGTSTFADRQHINSIRPGDAPTSSYTSMGADPLAYWDAHKGLLALQEEELHQNGAAPSFDQEGPDQSSAALLIAELRLLANAASDRAEMHAILAQQRDNWNKLFQRMLASASMTACLLSALTGQFQTALSPSLPALLLNAGAAAMMAVINKFQPSQLAEEQRTAARLFRKLASDVHYALHVPPHLRQSTPSFLNDCKRRLCALDKAFPMPLTPGGLEKFPSEVVPPVLIEPVLQETSAAAEDIDDDHQTGPYVHVNTIDRPDQNNGWDWQLIRDMGHVAATLRGSDIPKYTGWAQNLVKVNKCLAIAAPCFAASAALLNIVLMAMSSSTAALPTINALGMWAAICSVLAAFAGSFSNDMQMGMVFELYRSSAGYYADVEASIQETLRMPVEQRENGTLFRQRVAYQLGRWPISRADPVVPGDAKEAGTLF